jgi:hyperosmotically inducible protein
MLKTLMISLALAASFGCATTRNQSTNRTAGQVVDDATITTNANAAIVGDEDASFFKIAVTTRKGDVVLRGTVNTAQTETRLVARIERMRGVNSVRSELRIELPTM